MNMFKRKYFGRVTQEMVNTIIPATVKILQRNGAKSHDILRNFEAKCGAKPKDPLRRAMARG